MIPKGHRHSTLDSLAGTMNKRGMILPAIEAALLAENATRCNPPLPECEVLEIAEDIQRRYVTQGQRATPPVPTIKSADDKLKQIQLNAARLRLRRGTDIVPRKQSWITHNFLPAEDLTLVAAATGVGKTRTTVHMSASITSGRVPVTGEPCAPRNVLFLSNEDAQSRLHEMFVGFGGDLSRFFVIEEDADHEWSMDDVTALDAQMELLEPALVVIDTLVACKPDEANLNSNGDMVMILKPLRRLANARHCCIVVLHHDNKTLGLDALRRVSGAGAITSTPRHIISMAQHPEDETRCVAVISKTNLCWKGGRPELRVHAEPDGVESLPTSPQMTMSQPADDQRSNPADAEEFLLEALKGGPVDCVVLKKLALDGYGIGAYTLWRTFTKLHLEREMDGFGSNRKVFWKLPTKNRAQSELPINCTINCTIAESAIDRDAVESKAFIANNLPIDCKTNKNAIDGAIDGRRRA